MQQWLKEPNPTRLPKRRSNAAIRRSRARLGVSLTPMAVVRPLMPTSRMSGDAASRDWLSVYAWFSGTVFDELRGSTLRAVFRAPGYVNRRKITAGERAKPAPCMGWRPVLAVRYRRERMKN